MKVAALLVAIVLVVPVSAAAQEVASSFEQLNRQGILEEGDTVRITLAWQSGGDYTEIECDVVALTNSAITVKLNSPLPPTDLVVSSTGRVFREDHVEIPARRVRRIEQSGRDSLLNGVLIGATS